MNYLFFGSSIVSSYKERETLLCSWINVALCSIMCMLSRCGQDSSPTSTLNSSYQVQELYITLWVNVASLFVPIFYNNYHEVYNKITVKLHKLLKCDVKINSRICYIRLINLRFYYIHSIKILYFSIKKTGI